MKNIFKQVQAKRPNSNTFDLSHDKKLSCNPGELVPVLMEEAVPGDVWKVRTSLMVRFAPMIAPIMHQVSAYVHFYFVPNRLLWENWEDFITGGEDGMDESVYPYYEFANLDPGNTQVWTDEGYLADYLGYPTKSADGGQSYTASAMPFAAYFLIYDEYYRDQNLVDKTFVPLVDGLNDYGLIRTASYNTNNAQVLRRAWQHDYFTSSLPFLQKGPEATLPLGSQAEIGRVDNQENDILYAGGNPGLNPVVADEVWVPGTPGTVAPETDLAVNANQQLAAGGSNEPRSVDNSDNLTANLGNWFANLATATASSINDLRRAFKLQEWLEKNARGGSRYTETIRSHFGVKSSDARLQRPEYIGGTKVPITISEVLQTSDTAATPQGNMAGHGIGYGNSGRAQKYIEEHGWIVGILSVMPKTAYQDGLPKKFFKFDKFDYYWPSFAHIGEQAVKNKEVHITHADPDGDFGYIPRYAEYKFLNSSVHGDFKEMLDFWHWGRKLDATVDLNEEFITCDPDLRIFAVFGSPGVDLDHLWIHVYHKISVKRLMPFFGNPKI